jgi:Ca-activated chloride channel family protein
MTFGAAWILWFLIAPAVALALDFRPRSERRARWPSIRRLWAGADGLAPAPAVNDTSGPRWRLWLALALAIAALARPQWGQIEEEVFEQSREVILALDLSRSMLVEDVRPNRLQRAKVLIENLLDHLRGERVGLILFAGTAFLQSPLSPDYEVLREFLPALGPDYLPLGGSNYDQMLEVALDSFSSAAGADRYLIILGDGEADDDTWRRRLVKLQQRDIRVIGLGIGTVAGGVIPAAEGGFVKDERGAAVLSRLEPATLQTLARATGGTYVEAAGWVDLPAVLAATVERGRQGQFVQQRLVRHIERFQWLLAPALLLAAWSYWREFPVHPRPRPGRPGAHRPPQRFAGRAGPHRTTATALLLLLCILRVDTAAQSAATAPPANDASLLDLVGQLAGRSDLAALDYARLAAATVAHGETFQQMGHPPPAGVMRDGLDAVAAGERLDAAAADWTGLRSALEELLQTPPAPPEENERDQSEKEQSNPDASDQRNDSGGERSEDASPQSGPPQPAFPDRPGPDPDQPSPDPTAPEGADGAQPPPATRQVGGERSPTKDELRDNPELAVPLHQLEEVRNLDSPPRLFQLMRRQDPPPPEAPRRDW